MHQVIRTPLFELCDAGAVKACVQEYDQKSEAVNCKPYTLYPKP